MEFEEIYKQVENLKGWMPKKDCEMLWQYTKDLKNTFILEIGCFMGRSTKTMALSSPTSEIVSIDPFLTVHPSSGESDPRHVESELKKTMRGLNWRLIRKKSQNVGKTWNRQIDFLHIDGNHCIKSLEKDIKLFVPYVKKGGYIFFHDYNIGTWTENIIDVEKKLLIEKKDKDIKPNIEKLEDDGAFVWFVVEKEKDKWFDQVIINPQVHGFAICRKK